jgi:hypothetical protein
MPSQLASCFGILRSEFLFADADMHHLLLSRRNRPLSDQNPAGAAPGVSATVAPSDLFHNPGVSCCCCCLADRRSGQIGDKKPQAELRNITEN